MSMQIPAHAAERLKGLRSSMHSTGVFTSDFSVNEFLLVRKAGFEPIGLCVGSLTWAQAEYDRAALRALQEARAALREQQDELDALRGELEELRGPPDGQSSSG